MPLTPSIDPARGRVETTATGPVTHAEVMAHLDWERAAGALPLPELIDATAATAALTPDEVRSLIHRLRELRRGSAVGPAAVVVADDLSYGMLRMLGILAEDVCDVCPFRDRAEAEAWLAGVPGPRPPTGPGG